MPLNSEHAEASFSPNSTYPLCLQLAQVPRSPDLVNFVSMTTMTQPIALPLAHSHGVKIKWWVHAYQFRVVSNSPHLVHVMVLVVVGGGGMQMLTNSESQVSLSCSFIHVYGTCSKTHER